MDLKLIQRLVRMMKRADVTDLEIDDAQAGMRVRLKRGAQESPSAPVVVMQGGGEHRAPVAAQPSTLTAAKPNEFEDALEPEGHAIESPLVGTFYRAASPDVASFVEIGTQIEVDQVLCIVEAMKVMNEIKSDVAGEVIAILAENGEPVEYGQPLFLLGT